MQKQGVKHSFGKILSFLRVRAVAGGLEVSDQVLRLAYADRKTLNTAAIALGPGVMERGVIKDAQAFGAALLALRAKVPGFKDPRKKMNVFVSLSSANIYTQSFTLPLMEGDELEKAIDLNVQMASPDDFSKSYVGSKVLGRDEVNLKVEISSSFISKELVDGVTQALYAAGFITVGVESRALSLVRILHEQGQSLDFTKAYLMLDVDNSGIDFLVIRKSQLYFEYSTPWTDIADAKGQVTVEKFKESISAELRQVINFYRQRWPDPLAGIIVSSMVFAEEASSVAADTAALPVVPLSLGTVQASPEWFVALGAQMRGTNDAAGSDADINLAGEDAGDAFRREQMMSFLELWQVLIPTTLCLLVLVLVAALNFLSSTETKLAAQAASQQNGQQQAKVEQLEASSTFFNNEVQLALAAQANGDMSHFILAETMKLAKNNSVTVSHLTFHGAGSPVSLSGVAVTEDDIVQFKNSLQQDPNFTGIDLPLSEIQPAVNQFSFSLTFSVADGAFKQGS